MKFAEKTIEDFLYTPNKSFVIPEFQRPYSWRAENVREFLADLEETIAEDKSHYFGTVVFVLDNIDSSSIIDGQQRVTTSLLMVMAIYHLLVDNPGLSSDPAITVDTIRENYLINRNNSSRVKLRTVTTDDTILQKIFDSNGDAAKITPSEKQSNLYQAYSEFRSYFAGKTDLSRYITGLGRFEIVTIALDTRDDNPQRVFESINSTGKPLTDGDKIRNFALMLKSDEKQRYVYDKYWKSIERSLTAVNQDYITDFFRSYIISKKQAVVRMDAVYPEFKSLFVSSVGDEQSLEDLDVFYSDITDSLQHYLVLKLGEDDSANYGFIKDVAFKMRYIQTDLYIPFAMSVLRHYENGKLSQDQVVRVFDIIESYFSRRIVCSINTTSVDRFLASLHKDVLSHLNENQSLDYVDVLSYLFLNRTGQTRMPSDTEIETAVRNNPTYTQRKSHVNYILATVDDLSRESDTLRQMASGNLKLSIEHVMPQTLTSEWRRELGMDEKGLEYVQTLHQNYLHTLANLTLTGYNPSYSNRSFKDKMTIKDGFADSPLKINKWIASRDTWNEAALRERQDWWLDHLNQAWPLPTTTYAPVEPDTKVYLLDETDLKGRGVRSVEIFGDMTQVSSWAELLDTVAEALYDRNPNFFDKVLSDEYLSRFINADKTGYFNSAEIYDTGYHIDTGSNTNSKLRILRAFANLFNISSEELTAELTPEGDGE